MGNQFGKGLEIGLAGLFGYGDKVDPRVELRKKLSDLQTKVQDKFNQGTITALKEQNIIDENMYKLIMAKQDQTDKFNAVVTESLWESIGEQNLFIIIMFVVINIVIFFNL